jgi:hypothetical protein
VKAQPKRQYIALFILTHDFSDLYQNRPWTMLCLMKFQVPVLGIIGGLFGLFLIGAACAVAYVMSPAFNETLTRGLSEEKSYFNHDGTNHRLRPELRGQKWNLETWDDAEEIARAVFANGSTGVWATWSDHLGFLQPRLQRDRNGREM